MTQTAKKTRLEVRQRKRFAEQSTKSKLLVLNLVFSCDVRRASHNGGLFQHVASGCEGSNHVQATHFSHLDV